MTPQAKSNAEEIVQWMGRIGIFVISVSVPIFFNQTINNFNEIQADIKKLLQNDIYVHEKVVELESRIKENKLYIQERTIEIETKVKENKTYIQERTLDIETRIKENKVYIDKLRDARK